MVYNRDMERGTHIANAIIEMLTANWQRSHIEARTVRRTVAHCDLTYSAEARTEPDHSLGFDGGEESQEFTLHTEHPLTGGEARAVEKEVYNATSHNIVLDIDVDSKCWGMKLEQAACHV